jgi:hypothetical protein
MMQAPMSDERGVALIVAMMAMMLLSAVGAALVLTTTADVLIAANAGAASEAFHAADAVFERSIAELRAVPDFTSILNGSIASVFVDDALVGERALADGTRIDLAEVLNLANCQKRSGCTESDLNASIRDRPWGLRNPRWRLFSHGPVEAGVGSMQADLPVYVVAMVADDPSDADGDPWRDGAPTGAALNAGAGILLLRTESFGRRGAHRVVEGTIIRQDLVALAAWNVADPATRGNAPSVFPLLQVLAWREVR